MTDDSRDEPEIDPNYFEYETDLDVLVEIAKFTRKVAATAPLRDMVGTYYFFA